MKSKILIIITIAITLLAFPKINFGQVTLGTSASEFVLFTSTGAIDDNVSAQSHITGNVGTNTSGSITDFGNIDGIMHPGADAVTALVDADLLSTIAQINALPATLVGPLALGSGFTITPGVWSIPGNATLTLDLLIDGQNDPNAEFIIKVAGTFSTNTLSSVRLINGAKACHVFWKIDGAVTMASLSTMRGNVITGGAILMGSGDTLEGRMFVTPAGAITIDKIAAFMPIGCNSPVLTGPNAPNIASLSCYTIFTSNGALDGNLSSTSIGDVGNAGGGSVTGWTAGNVTGILHGTGDPSTMLAATDLTNLYNTLNAMIPDIELLYPVSLGSNLVLTPHVYLINSSVNGPATLTDTIVLNAQGNPSAVFVFKIINGAFTTSVASAVKLINGAQAKNVFWMVDGAMSINNNSVFRGTIVLSSGALNLVNTGLVLEGRAFTLVGAITTAGMAATMTPGCGGFDIVTDPSDTTVCEGNNASFSVTATNATGYQWREDSGSGFVNLVNGAPYSGVNTAVLVISPASVLMNNNKYQCEVTSSSGTIYSNFASLTVNDAPSIMSIAQDTVCGPDSLTLGATASGGIIQWYADSVGGISLNTGMSYITPLISVSDTFYVEATFGSCASFPRTMVIATVNPVYNINNPQAICNGSSYLINGNTYTIAGNYSDTLFTVNGCDSIIITQLTVDSAYVMNNPQAICAGDSYVFNGNTYTLAGNYNDTLFTVNGCDSIIVTQLTVDSAYNINNPQTICSGDSYVFNGNTYTLAGNYNDTLFTVNGCDSIIVTQLTVNPVFSTNNPQTICSGDSLVFNGNTYTVTGNYSDTLSTVNGCDSIIVTQLTVNALPVAVVASNSPVCIGTTINLTAQAVLGATYSWTGPNGFSSAGQNPTIVPATAAEAGIYTLTVSSFACPSDTATVLVVVSACNPPADLAVLKAVDNLYPFIGKNVVFTITASNNGPSDATGVIVTDILQNGYSYVSSTTTAGNYDTATGLWTIGNLNNGASETMTITAKVNTTGNYANTATINGNEVDANSSNNSAALETFPTDFFIPEGFSPNDDLVNDVFVIRGILNYPSNNFTVFNRWGNKVFEMESYQNTWDGKSTSNINIGDGLLPVGTYFYVLDLGDGSAIFKGTIYLNN